MLLLTLVAPAFATDGALEINQTCAMQTGCFAGEFAGFPVTITSPGSDRLTSNLIIASTTVNAITMSVDEMTLDLNGFVRGMGGEMASTSDGNPGFET